jgi:predicted XRE-type DNA-binding protein
MKSATPRSKPGHVTTGDIFDDLGFSKEDTLEAKIKADIWQALIQHIESNTLTQAQLATVLKAHQPDVSNLLKGKISRFSITKLLQFAGRLNLEAKIRVTASKTVPATSGLVAPRKGKRSLVGV